jgi:hypothetical protein
MAAPRIKKASKQQLAAKSQRQAAIPCLILVALGLILAGVFLFFSFRMGS